MTDTPDTPKLQDPALVERIARAIYLDPAYTGGDAPVDPAAEWDDTDERICTSLALAALTAIEAAGCVVVPREPTEPMLDAPWRASPSVQVYQPTDLTQTLDSISFERIWRAMIAAALAEGGR